MSKIFPRKTPDRDSRYMALAWFHAGFSKDPSTQVGAQIVSLDNKPLGSGYNGPPRTINDEDVIWDRPKKDNFDEISKYDLIIHAEINAINHCHTNNLNDATLYVTALPCPRCMLEIAGKGIGRVVYFDFQSSKNSSLQNKDWIKKSLEIAKLANISLEKFSGNLNWMMDWCLQLKQNNLF